MCCGGGLILGARQSDYVCLQCGGCLDIMEVHLSPQPSGAGLAQGITLPRSGLGATTREHVSGLPIGYIHEFATTHLEVPLYPV